MTPPIHAVIETAINIDDLDTAEHFFSRILGLKAMTSSWQVEEHYLCGLIRVDRQ